MHRLEGRAAARAPRSKKIASTAIRAHRPQLARRRMGAPSPCRSFGSSYRTRQGLRCPVAVRGSCLRSEHADMRMKEQASRQESKIPERRRSSLVSAEGSASWCAGTASRAHHARLSIILPHAQRPSENANGHGTHTGSVTFPHFLFRPCRCRFTGFCWLPAAWRNHAAARADAQAPCTHA